MKTNRSNRFTERIKTASLKEQRPVTIGRYIFVLALYSLFFTPVMAQSDILQARINLPDIFPGPVHARHFAVQAVHAADIVAGFSQAFIVALDPEIRVASGFSHMDRKVKRILRNNVRLMEANQDFDLP